MRRVLAFDIGASSGRAIVGELSGKVINMHEIRRFSNDPVNVCGHTHWDILRLFHEMKQAIKAAGDIDSIGIDTWGVDFGLVDKNGQLMGNPYHYRDIRNNDTKKLDVYKATGIQYMQFNTLYQLQKTDLTGVEKLLMVPDLLAYFLTGQMRMEYTNASTTNLLNAFTHELDTSVLEKIGVNRKIFPPMIRCGDIYGCLSDDICHELSCKKVPVIAVGTHDTASAVASIPADKGEDFVYISSGTWSLFGTISDRPLVNDLSEEMNFTNELGIDFKIRLLKNIMGLWLMQEMRREYDTTFPTLSQEAEKSKPFQYIIDPDSDSFLGIGNMSERIFTAIGARCSMGELARCIYDSLALKYRFTLDNLQELTGKTYKKLYMFGGGIKDRFLCQLTANACGIPVITCSSEATALGNIAVQLAETPDDIPQLMKASTKTEVFTPENKELWNDAYIIARKRFSR